MSSNWDSANEAHPTPSLTYTPLNTGVPLVLEFPRWQSDPFVVLARIFKGMGAQQPAREAIEDPRERCMRELKEKGLLRHRRR